MLVGTGELVDIGAEDVTTPAGGTIAINNTIGPFDSMTAKQHTRK